MVSRLTDLVRRTSGGHFGTECAGRLMHAANEAIELWRDGGLDFDELA